MNKHSKKQLTEKDKKIFAALCELSNGERNEFDYPGIGPREIGMKVGRDKYDAAAYCNLSLKKLVEFDLVEKLPNGKYLPRNETEGRFSCFC
ncbi:hypothetical protein [Mesobacillus subterraneus]|uniref:Uncharacterized protein n=1 Tax=Mesobacillus subterraneus TaxID=285983 RepID=A0A427TNZ8_9BACI|nr:hypothetical protein [Mesobacillus subterraneus]RSD26084.1 hypothetical protein EJA10_14740 [Mesobacillus subterraneus]